MHIYAYGSICRGEITPGSDVDLLVIDPDLSRNVNPEAYSIYSHERIEQLWTEGNPFAWHLHLEARELYSSDGSHYIYSLGSPQPYNNAAQDCTKFRELFEQASNSLRDQQATLIFDLSSIFLSMRNIATCYLLGVERRADFSRNAALHLGSESVPISHTSYQVLERARILCTRAYGPRIHVGEMNTVLGELEQLGRWMEFISEKAFKHERV